MITYAESAGDEKIFSPWAKALSEFSVVEKVSEEMIDLTTPELGSGPGYAFEMIRLFSNSLIEKGVADKRAQELAALVFPGRRDGAANERVA